MKKFIYLICLMPIMAMGQTTTQNYVKSTIYRDSIAGSIATAQVNVIYIDGLGRPIQKIEGKMSGTGHDLITPIEYDSLGRQRRDYMPYPVTTTTLTYDASGPTNAIQYYRTSGATITDTTSFPFSEKFLENSPLNRVLKQSAPGTPWKGNKSNDNDHTLKMAYLTNVTSEVKYLKATAAWNTTNLIYDESFVSSGSFYAAGQLYKTITQDENKTGPVYTGSLISSKTNTVEEFKDKEGHIVLKRMYNVVTNRSLPSYQVLDTYYVYDQFGNLAYVLPPLCEGANTNIDTYGYQYKYDARNRQAEKKLPGKQWEYTVYDVLDRPVATGPAFSPFGDSTTGWMITKYDAFGRVAYTGWYASATFTSAGRQAMQANTFSVVTKTPTATTIDNIGVNYTNSFPTTMKVLSINYYDNYMFANAPALTSAVELQSVSSKVNGLATGSWVRLLTSASETFGELSYTFYDRKGRPIRTRISNTYLGGYTQTDTRLDFDSTLLYTITRHKRATADTELLVREDFTYTAQDRLLTDTHSINGVAGQKLSESIYNDLGQLITKKVGSYIVSKGSPALAAQTVDYKYNVRGWLTDINDIASLGSDLFAYKVSYDKATDDTGGLLAAGPLYNGNISETYWRTSSDNAKRKYSYAYDKLNRLTAATYQKPGANVVLTGSYNESLTYDKNGNITGLIRNGGLDDPSNQVQIDNLVYTYQTSSNKLAKVVDSSNSTEGFKDSAANTVDDYSYDANGNLTLDNNKGIMSITYNHLNLPVVISFGATNKITYLYDAAGVKLKKTVVEVQSGSPVTMVVDYLGGFQYKAGVLQFFPMSEGYVDNTVNSSGANVFNYVYQYKDHLGNARLNYAVTTSTVIGGGTTTSVVIKEQNHYYPFGLKHMNYNMDYLDYQEIQGSIVLYPPITSTGKLAYNYKYNGKELQDELGLNMYDYGARNYDPALGRWMNIDPKAETSRRWSPYTYAYNNPIRFVDPDGMQADDFVQRKDGSIYWDKNANSQASTKSGETYLGKNLTFKFNSYIDGKLWDGPGGSIAAGDKLTSTVSLNAKENSDGELTGISATKSVQLGDTPVGSPRDYYPGEGGSNNVSSANASVNSDGTMNSYNLNFEQHASVSKVEEFGLNVIGYKIVDVAQKLNINFESSSGNLSVSSATNIFPSANLSVNGNSIMQYNQPSFVKTHTAPLLNLGGTPSGQRAPQDFSYYPSVLTKRN